MSNDGAWFRVTLREWVESQRQEHTPHRAALVAAIESSDLARLRELMAEAPFDTGQRRYLDDLLTRWAHAIAAPPASQVEPPVSPPPA